MRSPIQSTSPTGRSRAGGGIGGACRFGTGTLPGCLLGPGQPKGDPLKTMRLLALACLVACTTTPQPRPAPTPAIEGIVVGPDGKGIAGALVAAVRYDSTEPSASALSVSGADGRVRLEGLPDGTYAFTATVADVTAAYLADVEV